MPQITMTLIGLLATGKHSEAALSEYRGKQNVYPVSMNFLKTGYVLFYFALEDKTPIELLDKHKVDMIKEIVKDKTGKEARRVMIEYTYNDKTEQNGAYLQGGDLEIDDFITTPKVIDDFEILHRAL